MNSLESFNHGVYSFFLFLSRQHPELADLMHAFGYLGNFWVLLAVTVWAMWRLRWHRIGTLGLMVVLLAWGVVELLRHWLPRPRPTEASDWVHHEEMLRGFPSGEILVGCLVYYLAALGLASRPGRSPVLGFALAILAVVLLAASQLWMSLHFLTDILAGILGGLGLVLFLAKRQRNMKA